MATAASLLQGYINQGVCANLCSDGRQPRSIGVVRMKAVINGYCPFYGIKDQVQHFVLDSSTLNSLPDDITSRIELPGGGVDGVMLRPVYVYRSNLMFVQDQSQNYELLGDKLSEVSQMWDNGKSKDNYEFLPHYAWDCVGSLFDPNMVLLEEYNDGIYGTANPSGPSNGSPSKENFAQFAYLPTNAPPVVQVDPNAPPPPPAGTPDPNAIFQEARVLMIEQKVVGVSNGSRGVHFSAQKHRPVFQGADFWFRFDKLANNSTIENTKNTLQTKYNFLDANLASPTAGDGTTINGAIVNFDDSGAVVPSSQTNFDLNNQVYIVIEIGVGHKDHNYFIIIGQKSNPIFVHAGTTPQIIPDAQGDGYKVVTPSQKVSRRLATYDVPGDELLQRDVLKVRVHNYMGRIMVVFSGYEDNPWIIERHDLQAPTNEPGLDLTDPSNYTTAIVPMVVPAANLALHAGNRKMAWLWGYMKYEPEATIQIPQPIHIMGTKNATPTKSDVAVLLGMNNDDSSRCFNNPDDRSNDPTNDQLYPQDALKFTEQTTSDPQRDTILATVSPNTYKSWGKGVVGTGPMVTVQGSPSVSWPSQDEATPKPDLSQITSQILGDLSDVNSGEDRSQQFYTSVTLDAGHFTFPADPQNTSSDDIQFINVITPICTGYTVIVHSDRTAWAPQSIDVSHHVSGFTETWSSQDYARIEHTGVIKFLCNRGMRSVQTNTNLGGGSVNPDDAGPPLTGTPTTDYSDKLAQMTNRTFYITLSAWYQNSSIFTDCNGNGQNGDADDATIFVGLCHGGKLTYSNGQRMLECNVYDLSKVLQDQHFLNSPFFDSVRDFAAVYEIAKMAGLRDGGSGYSWTSTDVCPNSIVGQAYEDSRTATGSFPSTYYDGCGTKTTYVQSFALPGSTSPLTQPKFKFNDGEKFIDAIKKMADVSGKCFYFDRFGMLHYEDRIDQVMSKDPASVTPQVIDDLAKEYFFSSPRKLTGQQGNPSCDDAGRIAYNSYTWQRQAGDVFNQIQIVTATPEGEVVSAGDINFDLLDTPDTPGFVGYTKQYLMMNGVFGSTDAVKSAVEEATAFYIPTLSVSFESYGRSYLKALDIIYFTGIDDTSGVNNDLKPMPLRITNISTEIDPNKNVWWSRFECEWIFPGPGVSWATGP